MKAFYCQIRNSKCHHIMSIFNINNESISNKPNNLPPNINFVQNVKTLNYTQNLNQIGNRNPKFGG